MTTINIIPNGYTFTDNVLNIPNNNPNITETSYIYGIYNVSASSSNNNNLPYKAFNQTMDTHWASDKPKSNNKYTNFVFTNREPATYVGGGSKSNTWKTIVNNKEIFGEWIQIQAPYKLYLDNYSLLSHPIIDINSTVCGNTYTGNAYMGNTYTGNAYMGNLSTCGNVSLPTNIPDFLKNNCPKQFFLLGSNDGNAWKIIDQRNLENYPMDLDKATTYYVD